MLKVETYQNADKDETCITARMSNTSFFVNSALAIRQEVISQVAKVIADKIIAEHLPEIMDNISATAIANMAIAEAGAAVNETLHKKLPDKILQIEKHSDRVYQRGLLGGLKRIS